MKKNYIYYTISGINIIFPILFLPINLFFIFFTKNLENKFLKILLFNFWYSISIFTFLHIKKDGDVYAYSLMYEHVAKKTDDLLILFSQLQYYSWIGLLKLSAYFDLNFQYVNVFCISLFYFSVFYNLMFFHVKIKDSRAFKIILFKILFTVSIFTIAQTYRNPLSFSLVMTGIIFFESKKIILSLLTILLGIGFHYSTFIFFIIYFFSKFFRCKKEYIIFSVILFFITNPLILQKIGEFLQFNYFLIKIESYTQGKWAARDYSSIVSSIINIGILINLYFYIYCFLYYKNKEDINFKKHQPIDNIKNFILIYIIFLIPLMFYRTILDRYSFSGGTFVLCLFSYLILSNGFFFKNKSNVIIFIVWLFYIDPNFLSFMINDLESLHLTFGGTSLFYQLLYSPILQVLGIY